MKLQLPHEQKNAVTCPKTSFTFYPSKFFLSYPPRPPFTRYYDLFWTHGNSKTIEVRGKTFTLPAPRSDFVDEARTTIYKNTKNEKELFINCYSVDMKTMGEMMGGTEFQEMGAMMWDMDPATGLKIRNAEGGG